MTFLSIRLIFILRGIAFVFSIHSIYDRYLPAYLASESVIWAGEDNHVNHSHIICIHSVLYIKASPITKYQAISKTNN